MWQSFSPFLFPWYFFLYNNKFMIRQEKERDVIGKNFRHSVILSIGSFKSVRRRILTALTALSAFFSHVRFTTWYNCRYGTELFSVDRGRRSRTYLPLTVIIYIYML